MTYEGNMKIGFLGGVKSGKVTNVAEDYNAEKLKWMVKAETNRYIPLRREGSQREIFTPGVVEVEDYHLLILKKDKVLKFFYVLKGMTSDEIRDLLITHWDNSDILGYDFD
jgi:hypothetical protein